MKKDTISKTLVILFVIWFIVSLVAIIINAENKNNNMVIILIGQYFLIFGIIGIYSAKEPMISLHYFVGLLLLTIGLIYRNYERLSIIRTDLSINQKLFIGLLLISLISIIITLFLFFKDKKSKKLIYPFLISNIIYVGGLLIITAY